MKLLLISDKGTLLNTLFTHLTKGDEVRCIKSEEYYANMCDYNDYADKIVSDNVISINSKCDFNCSKIYRVLNKIQSNPISTTKALFFNGIKNDNPIHFKDKDEVCEHLKKSREIYTLKFKDKVYYPCSFRALVNLLTLSDTDITLGKKINGKQIKVFAIFNGGVLRDGLVYLCFEYSTGFVVVKEKAEKSKIYKETIDKIKHLLVDYSGLVYFDTIINTSGVFTIRLGFGFDTITEIYFNYLIRNEGADNHSFFTRVFVNELIPMPYEKEIYHISSNIGIINNDYTMVVNSFFVSGDKIHTYTYNNITYYNTDYEREYINDLKWLKGQKVY